MFTFEYSVECSYGAPMTKHSTYLLASLCFNQTCNRTVVITIHRPQDTEQGRFCSIPLHFFSSNICAHRSVLIHLSTVSTWETLCLCCPFVSMVIVVVVVVFIAPTSPPRRCFRWLVLAVVLISLGCVLRIVCVGDTEVTSANKLELEPSTEKRITAL